MLRTCCTTADTMKADPASLRATLVGHPFSPLGTGRAIRVAFAACRSVGIETTLRDIWNVQAPETAQIASIVPFVTSGYGAVNIFHINGDEIAPTLDRIGPLPAGYNIVVPFWELPRYPAEWARQLERFDEVWAASDYILQSIGAAVDCRVTHMPLPTEVVLDSFRGRREFGIPENSYAFLFFFDCRSYLLRKNPQAVVECFRRLLAARPWARVCLVLKLHGVEAAPDKVAEFLASLSDLQERIVLLQASMQEVEVHNLIRCCDAFVSLHRSEGYGLGLAEAMHLGLPVIGTGYSGNMDFMTPDNSIVVGYRMVAVPPGAYPHAENQFWAEPDLNEATAGMLGLIDDPEAGRALGRRGSRSMRVGFSNRAAGLRYAQRLTEITADEALA
jgi:glycosyltransferase involved in cell wall biosynthesis